VRQEQAPEGRKRLMRRHSKSVQLTTLKLTLLVSAPPGVVTTTLPVVARRDDGLINHGVRRKPYQIPFFPGTSPQTWPLRFMPSIIASLEPDTPKVVMLPA